MIINEQLFEDVLSGKLKGTFVLRNGDTYFSNGLCRNYNKFRFTHPYVIGFGSYTSNGIYPVYGESKFDIIDFIPETNMKENELTIEIPDGKIVDWEESKKQNKIVLKDKRLTYEDVCKKLFNKYCYYIDRDGNIEHTFIDNESCLMDKNNASNKHQLECILAKNQLTNVAMFLNDEWKPKESETIYYIIDYSLDIEDICECTYGQSYMYGRMIFKSRKLAQQAIEILGEETVKLALEPLGI